MNDEVKNEEVSEEKEVISNEQADKNHEKVSVSTKETKEVLKLVFAFVKLIKEAKQNDGVIGAGDLALLVNLFPFFGPALDDLSNVPSELKDLDSKEIKDLLVFTGAQLSGVVSNSDEELVEKGLAAGIAIVELVALVMDKRK